MKTRSFFLLLGLISVLMLSCTGGPLNKIKLQNQADGAIILNFRASQLLVESGSTAEIQDIEKGEYEYETVFEIPAGTINSSSEGEMSGTFVLRAGTEILVIYTSSMDAEGNYKIYASVTSSEDVNYEGEIDPIGP